jgi:capsular polysaccharide biosynthesis protein
MPDIIDLFLRWWKQILAFVIISVAVTAIFVYSRHKQWLAVSTALPAPTYAGDKSGVFGQNLQVLYPVIGTPDDLDMILGTAQLDTVYSAVADKLDLTGYYGVDKTGGDAVKKAGSILKGKSRATKSDYGELKIKVWDGDPQKAAEMSNAIMEKLQQIHQDVQTANNIIMLEKIREEYSAKKTAYQKLLDSLQQTRNTAQSDLLNVEKLSLLQQIQEYERLLNQYQLMINAKPQALVIVERASTPIWPDKPKPKQTMLAAALLSLFFAFLLALVLERRRLARK